MEPSLWNREGGTWEEVWQHLEVVATAEGRKLPVGVCPLGTGPRDADGKVPDVPRVWMRDEKLFTAGGLTKAWPFWRDVLLPLSGLPERAPAGQSMLEGGPVLDRDTIASWLQEGVRVEHFLRPFKGNYAGVWADSPEPVSRRLTNPPLPHPRDKYEVFVDEEVRRSLLCGAVEEVAEQPFLVLPLIVEPRKPRLCFDARWGNLWFPSPLFRYDTLRDFQRGVRRNDWMFSLDHKSGYQHVPMHPSSQGCLGFEWRGKWYRYRVLPFGFAPACFIYQSLSNVVATALRKLLSLNLIAYIDDFGFSVPDGMAEGLRDRVRWCVLAIMFLAGYCVSEKKSQLAFTRRLRLLGLLVDSALERFSIPEDRLLALLDLRGEILTCVRDGGRRRPVGLKLLQRFVGKAESMALAVPPVSIFLRHLWDAIASAEAEGRFTVWLSDVAVLDVEELGGIQSWEPLSRWLPERHMRLALRLETDASLNGYGGVWFTGSGAPTLLAGLFEGAEAPLDIAPKEALAVQRALEAAPPEVCDCFVDLYVDNEVVEKTLLRGSSVIPEIRAVARDLLWFQLRRRVIITLGRVSTVDNVTSDGLSRGVLEASWEQVDKNEFRLALRLFDVVQSRLPAGARFTLDACASPLNTRVARFISRVRFPAELHVGVTCVAENVFTYEFLPRRGPGRDWVYCYPPLALISPLWRHLRLCGARGAFVFPDMPEQVWYATVAREALQVHVLARRGSRGALLSARSGYTEGLGPLPWDLLVAYFDFA